MKHHYKRIAVKVGSNVLTRADGTLDVTRMSAIVDQIAELYRMGVKVTLISSGAVASGRSELRGINSTQLNAVACRQLYSAVGQAKLINRYYELFREHGIACGQVLTTKENFATRRHYLNQKNCMEVMLANDVIPIVNENDTVSVTELMFTDNDELSGLIATMMDMDALIILSNIDGVFTGDPSLETSRLISHISRDDDASGFIQASKSSLGRGGMTTKYRIARKVASEGITVIIANGRRENILLDILNGAETTPFTTFEPSQVRSNGVKKWIAHSESFAKGGLRINRGAVEALLSSHAASVLPIGVVDVIGDFEKDDIVTVVDMDGHIIAWGKTTCDSEEARRHIGIAGGRPIIHADYLYIDQ